MRIENPDTGEILEVTGSPSLYEALVETWDSACLHEERAIRRRAVAGGAIQIKEQCLACGQPLGQPRRRTEFPHAEPFDEKLLSDVTLERKRRRWKIATDYINKKDRRELDEQRRYDAYLESEEWGHKRSLVLKRANGVCEGCLSRQASEVHHLSYRHFENEFLFELVALCRECHRRWHHDPSHDVEDPDGRPCRGCRYQGDGTLCPIFNVAEEVALKSERYCGPSLQGYEPLK